jgi:hypothetical protein
MGNRFWVGCGFFSWGGGGGQEETPGQVLLSVPDPRYPGQTRVLFKFRHISIWDTGVKLLTGGVVTVRLYVI